jgi:hypothetical protein
MPEVTHRLLARVAYHVNGGYSCVELQTGHQLEIPTNVIPADLRKIGSRFWLLLHKIRHDSREALRESLENCYAVERLQDPAKGYDGS